MVAGEMLHNNVLGRGSAYRNRDEVKHSVSHHVGRRGISERHDATRVS